MKVSEKGQVINRPDHDHPRRTKGSKGTGQRSVVTISDLTSYTTQHIDKNQSETKQDILVDII